MYVAPQLFDVRAAKENPKKARHKRCPRADEGTERCGCKPRQIAWYVPATHESHKLEHHDQRAWFRFGQAKSVHHLTWFQPVKILDSVLGDVLQHSVSTAKRDDRRFAKE